MEIGSVQISQPAPMSTVPVTPEARSENRGLIQAVKALNATELFGQNQELTFVFDRQSHRPLVRIVDRETREVIRQIPAEYALRMASDIGVWD